jgi:hypothetical protein
MAIGVSYGYMMFAITYAEIIMANFKIIEFLAVVAILSGFEMLQATFLAWSLWVVVPISQASAVKHISPSVIGNPHLTTVDGILHGLHSPWMQTLLGNLLL